MLDRVGRAEKKSSQTSALRKDVNRSTENASKFSKIIERPNRNYESQSTKGTIVKTSICTKTHLPAFVTIISVPRSWNSSHSGSISSCTTAESNRGFIGFRSSSAAAAGF